MYRIILMMMMTMMIAGCGEPKPESKTEAVSKPGADTASPPHNSSNSSMGGNWGKGAQTDEEKIAGLRQDAESGDAKSQLGLARKYYNGDDMPQDYAKAAEWYEKAAKQGIAMAQYNIGMMYQKGEGVTKDAAKAEEWLQKAAAQGLK